MMDNRIESELYFNLIDIHRTLSCNGLLDAKRVHQGTDNEDTIGELVEDTFEILFNEQLPTTKGD